MKATFLLATTLVALAAGAVPASARPYHGWQHARHCRVVWHHHHRVRRCW